PADQRRWAPAGLPPGDAFLAAFRVVASCLRLAREKRAVVQRVDVDDAPDALAISQGHRDIDAAASAENLLGRFHAERVSLKLLRLGGGQRDLRLRVGKGPRIMLAAERTLACAQHLIARLAAGRQFDAN